ncbi:hypothetical protein TrVFT333_002095 [Trichoderma virens FT-333]|nr:hypothetical protein TrVFT333_002095 [Trichoderma virens FT-333]
MIFNNGLLSVAAAVLQLASLSGAGIANRANSGAAEVAYSHDGRTCCTGGEPSAAFTGGKCEYDSHVLTPTIPEGTHISKYPPMNITGNATIPIQICNLGPKWEITEYILTDDYLDIYVNLNIDCGPYNEWDREWIRIHFDGAYRDAGKFTYEISWLKSTIDATITSKIHSSDFSVDFHGHLTGNGFLSSLDQSFDKNLRAGEVAAILSKANICH